MRHGGIEMLPAVAALCGLVAAVGCAGGGDEPLGDGDAGGSSPPIGALVTVLPQRPMVEAIGGDLVDVTVLVAEGQDPHLVEPMPSQLVAAAGADVWFTVGSGVEFELKNRERIAGQRAGMRVVDCHGGIDLLPLEGGGHGDHGEGEGSGAVDGQHHHGQGRTSAVTTDPHVWLAPDNLRVMADHVRDALIAIDPAHEDRFREGHAAYCATVDQLRADLDAALAASRGAAFLTMHPAWGYLARAYGLHQIAVEEGGHEPGPTGVASVIERARGEGASVILVSSLADPRGARVIADQAGLIVVPADPLAEDVPATLRAVARAISGGPAAAEPGEGSR